LIRDGKAFKPVAAAEGTEAARVFIKQVGDAYYLAVFNYKKKADKISFTDKELGLAPGRENTAIELLSGEQSHWKKNFSVSFSAEGAYIYTIKSR